MPGKNKQSSLTKRVVLFLVVGFVAWLVFFRDASQMEQGPIAKEWLRSPKVLSQSVSEKELDQFPADAYSYIAMIDAGSSGCRAHVYRYGLLGDDKNGALYVLPNHESLKVKPGLSSFKDSPKLAGPSLEGLITFMKTKVPEAQWTSTPIYLKATAGMRLVGEKERAAILSSVQGFLGDTSKNPFAFHPGDAKVISGIEEGAFGWIAVNYLKHTIGPHKPSIAVDKQAAFVVVEMGGASTQVTQVAKTAHDELTIEDGFKFEFIAQDEKLVLYSHSYLGFGAEKAREALTSHLVSERQTPPRGQNLAEGGKSLQDPCLNPGYSKAQGSSHASIYEGVSTHRIEGVGNADTCHTSVEKAMFSRRHGGSDLKCKKNSTAVSFDCIHQPSFVRHSPNILVFENFFYMANAVGTLPADHETNPSAKSGSFPLLTSPKEFLDSAMEVCPVPWEKMSTRFPKEASQNARWCFSTTYAYLFLTHGIGLEDAQAITVQQSVGSADVEWALGATYKELSDELAVIRKQNVLGSKVK